MTLPMPDMLVAKRGDGGVDGRGQFFLGKRLRKVILQMESSAASSRREIGPIGRRELVDES